MYTTKPVAIGFCTAYESNHFKCSSCDQKIPNSCSGRGTYSELGGYLNYPDTFVWRKLQSYGVTLKIGGLQPPSLSLSAAYELLFMTNQYSNHIHIYSYLPCVRTDHQLGYCCYPRLPFLTQDERPLLH